MLALARFEAGLCPGSYEPGSNYSPGSYEPGSYHSPGSYEPGSYHSPGSYERHTTISRLTDNH